MGKLEIRELTKRFESGDESITAVDGLDIEIDDGEFIVLVGPSGCGKSTTLRCIAGLETVTEGDIILDDNVVTGNKPRDRNMAMVFQSYALYPHKTARGNMSFGLQMTTDLSKSEINDRVDDVAEMMGISELLDDPPGELSGGQQQRVALGRAIVREPEVFLMDEPLSNLDAKLRTTMRTELQELQQRLNVTTIYVTHDQTEAMTMGDRIVVLNEGQLQQIGTPLELYHEPVNQFVAGFIGSPSMNFLDTQFTNEMLKHGSFEYELSPEISQSLSSNESDSVTLGIRPEDIEIAQEAAQNAIDITVNVTEPLGDTILVNFTIGDTDCTASVPGDLRVSAGDELSIVFPEETIHLFDRSSGEAIKNREFSTKDNLVTGVNV